MSMKFFIRYDFIGAANFLLNEQFGLTLPNPWPVWDGRTVIKEAGGRGNKEYGWLWKQGVQAGLFRYGHVKRGAFRVFNELQKQGHEMVAITKRPKTVRADTYEWLGFMRFAFDEVHILGPNTNKSTVPHCDVYIDDSSGNIDDLLRAGKKNVCLLDYPHNRGDNKPALDGYNRVESLEQFGGLVTYYATTEAETVDVP